MYRSVEGMYGAGEGIYRAGKGLYRAAEGIKKRIDASTSLNSFEIQNNYKNEPRFNDVYSRDNLPKTIKSGA